MALFKRNKSTTSVNQSAKVAMAKVNQPVLSQRRLLLKPLVTEKATVNGTYCFKVAPDANKQEIAKEFKLIYGKTPRKVNVLNRMGKTVQRGRVSGKQADTKKAIIYLNKSETIDVFAN